ncbi:hypothetical protein [Peredibacter starrii]|uniref:Secreted protein n=1 Tax=Peredibacter starrii TaxID=28202 RepID=A0AAX4HKZ9_9BACT|nr:hypothetical protein [Peredibacter starrii]WPU63896.1 hypothetical protein SOO65_14470 [Peredibacter starrii]
MMRKILILTLAALSFGAFAQTAEEEAIILNQELQFLEDSVNNTQAVSINTLDVDANRNRAINDEGLERTYFGETEEDVVSTRTASPKRRSN